jgi:hypothetical protein
MKTRIYFAAIATNGFRSAEERKLIMPNKMIRPNDIIKNGLYVVLEEGVEDHIAVNRVFEDRDEAEKFASKHSNEIISMRVEPAQLIRRSKKRENNHNN